MAKEFKDCRYEFERMIAFAVKNMVDDATHIKVEPKEIDITILQVLSHAICTLAYVGGMDKDAFMEAMDGTWDASKKEVSEAEERINKYVKDYKAALEDAAKTAGVPVPGKDEPPLKN
jgi:hypothetical protein